MAKKTTAKKATTKRFQMSEDHKAALAVGRAEGRAIRAYLAALEQGKKTGRKVDASTLEARVAEVQRSIDGEPDPAKRIELIQKRLDLESQLVERQEEADLDALEDEFVKAVPGYADRKGITYSAWREIGVPAAVLKRAGVKRTRRTS